MERPPLAGGDPDNCCEHLVRELCKSTISSFMRRPLRAAWQELAGISLALTGLTRQRRIPVAGASRVIKSVHVVNHFRI
jgi:hypothetical protein